MKFTEKDPDLLGLGLSRRWEGAIIGVLLFLLVSFLFWGFTPLALVFFVVSIIPAAFIGSLIISQIMTQRTIGIILLVIFIVVWMYFVFFYAMMMD